jgi:hypothetical protein
MRKLTVSILLCAVSGLLLAIPATAADKTEARPSKAKAVTATTTRSVWPAETFSGTIITVKPDQKLVVVKDPDGVPFDMVVTPKTRIGSGNRAVALKDLTQYQNKDVSVRFFPERRGDVAESIRIGG